MSVEFSNAYQEILFDNLMSIIKQNFVFQTQLKMSEELGKNKLELEAKYNELLATVTRLQTQAQEAESLKSIAHMNDSAHQEKSRIQLALNNEMKKSSELKKQLENKDGELITLKDYITKLEEIAPISKLKKINPEKYNQAPEPIEPAPKDLFTIKANDGSSF